MYSNSNGSDDDFVGRLNVVVLVTEVVVVVVGAMTLVAMLDDSGSSCGGRVDGGEWLWR